jgi:hypothetical protein
MDTLEEIIDEYDAYDRDHPEYNKEDIINQVLIEIDNDDYSKNIDGIQLLRSNHDNYLEKLLEILDDNNINEVAKLIDFLIFYYQQELVCLKSSLDSLNEDYIEVYYDKMSFIDRQVIFNEFIETKINELKGVKSIEKKQII